MIQDTKKVRTSLHPIGFITNIVPCCCGFLFIRDGECTIQCSRFLKPAIPIKLCTLSQDNRHFLLLLYGWRNSCCPKCNTREEAFPKPIKIKCYCAHSALMDQYFDLFLQEYDRQASATVKRMFDEIDGMLFEGKPFNGKFNYPCTCILYLIIL